MVWFFKEKWTLKHHHKAGENSHIPHGPHNYLVNKFRCTEVAGGLAHISHGLPSRTWSVCVLNPVTHKLSTHSADCRSCRLSALWSTGCESPFFPTWLESRKEVFSGNTCGPPLPIWDIWEVGFFSPGIPLTSFPITYQLTLEEAYST
jgi:hypothetical protein